MKAHRDTISIKTSKLQLNFSTMSHGCIITMTVLAGFHMNIAPKSKRNSIKARTAYK